MRMSRWMMGIKRIEKIRTEDITASADVANRSENIREARLICSGRGTEEDVVMGTWKWTRMDRKTKVKQRYTKHMKGIVVQAEQPPPPLDSTVSAPNGVGNPYCMQFLHCFASYILYVVMVRTQKNVSIMYGPEGWAHWRHSPRRVRSRPLHCVGSGTASSASRHYRKGNACDQFVTKFNDTQSECIIILRTKHFGLHTV